MNWIRSLPWQSTTGASPSWNSENPNEANWHFFSACGMGYAFACKKLEEIGSFNLEF